jgi:hypothetical protein
MVERESMSTERSNGEWQPALAVNYHGFEDKHGASGKLIRIRPYQATALEKILSCCDAEKFYQCDDGEIVCEHEILTD